MKKPDDIKKAEGKLSYEERKDISRKHKKAQQLVSKCEEEIALIESHIEELDIQMQDVANASDPDFVKKYQEVNSSLEIKMQEWEDLHEELEKVEVLKKQLD